MSGLGLGLSPDLLQAWIPRDAKNLVGDWDANVGKTLSAGHVTHWVDQVNSIDLTSGVAVGFLPTVTANALGTDSAVTWAGAPTSTSLQATFTLNAPCMLLLVLKTTPGAAGVADIMFDGINVVTLVGAVDNSPTTAFNCGSAISYGAAIASGAYKICSFVSNGASSKIRENRVTKVTGNAGAGNPGGLTMGALSGGTRSAPMSVIRALLFNSIANLDLAERYLHERYPLVV